MSYMYGASRSLLRQVLKYCFWLQWEALFRSFSFPLLNPPWSSISSPFKLHFGPPLSFISDPFSDKRKPLAQNMSKRKSLAQNTSKRKSSHNIGRV